MEVPTHPFLSWIKLVAEITCSQASLSGGTNQALCIAYNDVLGGDCIKYSREGGDSLDIDGVKEADNNSKNANK